MYERGMRDSLMLPLSVNRASAKFIAAISCLTLDNNEFASLDLYRQVLKFCHFNQNKQDPNLTPYNSSWQSLPTQFMCIIESNSWPVTTGCVNIFQN